jgi:hypothetical protein
MTPQAVFKVSVTEVPQFRRLVEFLEAVENVGRINADDELQELVEECREDLLRKAG